MKILGNNIGFSQSVQSLEYAKKNSNQLSTQERSSFFTPKRIAMLGITSVVAATIFAYFAFRRTSPYQSCEVVSDLDAKAFGEHIAATLKRNYQSVCGKKSSKIVSQIDKDLKNGLDGAGNLRNHMLGRVEFRPGIDIREPSLIISPSCQNAQGFLKKDIAFEIYDSYCKKYGKPEGAGRPTTHAEYMQCIDDTHQYYIDNTVLNLKKDCDP